MGARSGKQSQAGKAEGVRWSLVTTNLLPSISECDLLLLADWQTQKFPHSTADHFGTSGKR